MNVRTGGWFMCAAIAACANAGSARAAEPVFDRVAAIVESTRGYSMHVDLHEERDDRSEDLSYTYDRPQRELGRIVIEEGRGAGRRVDDLGSGRVAVHAENRRFVVVTRLDDARLATLRGSNVRAAGLEAFVDCARAHPAALSQRDGPKVDGTQTVALIIDRKIVRACPGDSPLDADLTYDVLYVASANATPVLRKRYAGREVVVRWRIRHFGPGPSGAR